jgi:hypothetical protein
MSPPGSFEAALAPASACAGLGRLLSDNVNPVTGCVPKVCCLFGRRRISNWVAG